MRHAKEEIITSAAFCGRTSIGSHSKTHLEQILKGLDRRDGDVGPGAQTIKAVVDKHSC